MHADIRYGFFVSINSKVVKSDKFSTHLVIVSDWNTVKIKAKLSENFLTYLISMYCMQA